MGQEPDPTTVTLEDWLRLRHADGDVHVQRRVTYTDVEWRLANNRWLRPEPEAA
jgi:hypothetical protein